MKNLSGLPAWPDTEPISTEHRDLFEERFASSEQEACELSFAEMFAWRLSKNIRVSRIGNCICVFLEKNGNKYFYRPLGNSDEEAAAAAKRILENNIDGLKMYAVEKGHKILEFMEGFEITDDRDNYDYLYLVKELAELNGRKYDGKRNHLKKFLQNEFEFVDITPELVPACVDFQHRWCSVRPCKEDMSLRNESAAVLQILKHFAELPVFGSAILVKGRVEAYTVASRLNADTATVIVEKADYEFKGIYQAINKFFCEKMLAMGYTYANRQQDTGDEGLRKAKLSYHPERLIEKVIVGKK